MIKRFLISKIVLLILLSVVTVRAQIQSEAKPEAYPKHKLGGVFLSRYMVSLTDRVDVNGRHHPAGDFINNTFDIRRMRVFLNTHLTDKLEVMTLVNLAEFKGDPKGKVLENAYVKYNHNKQFQVKAGQFKPMFGLETTNTVDFVKSGDYSYSYYVFSPNGWTSYQMGVGIEGKLGKGSVPVKYGLALTNGNGKNKLDTGNGKHWSGELEFEIDKAFNAGIFGGIGGLDIGQTHGYGVLAYGKTELGGQWSFDYQIEAKKGINHGLYDGSAVLKDFEVKTYYILPNLRYEVNKDYLQSVEFSCRYEYLDENAKLNSNAREVWTPMLGFEILKNYGARIKAGLEINQYHRDIVGTTAYSSNQGFLQLQVRLQ